MREIKFRGKTKEKGKWVYGFFVKDATCSVVYIENHAGIEYSGSHSYFEVASESVGQLAAIIDGKEIYELDVIQFKDMRYNNKLTTRVVEWNVEGGVFFPLLWYCNDIKVIGNKIDNPELAV